MLVKKYAPVRMDFLSSSGRPRTKVTARTRKRRQSHLATDQRPPDCARRAGNQDSHRNSPLPRASKGKGVIPAAKLAVAGDFVDIFYVAKEDDTISSSERSSGC
jgi:hypothetical protein